MWDSAKNKPWSERRETQAVRQTSAFVLSMWDKAQLMLLLSNMLYALAMLLLLYAVLFLLVHLPIFPLRHVDIKGELGHVTREQVQFVVTREFKGNFFTLDLNQARRAFEKLPWVRSVSVRRRWPDRLEVALDEHQVLARWGNMALVNSKGELFQGASNADLPVFSGPAGSEQEITQHYEIFRQQLATLKLVPAQVNLSQRRAWQLRLKNGLVLELGREQVDARLAKFISVYDNTLGKLSQQVVYVDLRYPNGFAVRLPGGVKTGGVNG